MYAARPSSSRSCAPRKAACSAAPRASNASRQAPLAYDRRPRSRSAASVTPLPSGEPAQRGLRRATPPVSAPDTAMGPRGLTARPHRCCWLRAERLDLRDADLRGERTRRRTVGRGTWVVVLLARVLRVTGALARHDDDAKMRRLHRGDREGTEVDLRSHRPESTTGEGVRGAG